MPISSAEAAAALHDAESVGRRTRAAGAYASASPHLMLSGAIWLAGYVGCGLLPPQHWGLLWLPLVLLGAVGAALIASRARHAPFSPPVSAGRMIALPASIMLFMASLLLIFRPQGTAPYLALPPLVAAFLYMLLGSYGLTRFVWIGGGLFAATMASYLLAPALLPFLLGLAGGGALLLGGLWLRRI